MRRLILIPFALPLGRDEVAKGNALLTLQASIDRQHPSGGLHKTSAGQTMELYLGITGTLLCFLVMTDWGF